MAWDGVVERRRGPRADAGDQVDCRFEIRTRVRLLDISASGALLASDAPLPVEASGQLKAVLETGHFSASLQVRRTAGSTRDGMLLGTVFQGMDEESKKSLEGFLRKATS